MPLPPLSIVIPTFNTAALTIECCRAVLRDLPAGAEVIVVDDASTDGTAGLLRSACPAVRVLRLETNRRFAGAANAGVAASTGDLVLLLNSDAIVEPGALSALIAAFAAEPRLGVAGARLLSEDGSPQWSGGPAPTIAWLAVMIGGIAPYLPRRSSRRGGSGPVAWVSGAAMAFRREVWNAAGPFREDYRFYAQDLELCVRATDTGWLVRIVDEARVTHGGGRTMRQWRGVEELAHDPALLWLDLLTWGRARYGRLWAHAAVLAACTAALLRIAARRLRELLLLGDARTRSRAVTAVYLAALQQLLQERQQLTRERGGVVPLLDEPPAGGAELPRP